MKKLIILFATALLATAQWNSNLQQQQQQQQQQKQQQQQQQPSDPNQRNVVNSVLSPQRIPHPSSSPVGGGGVSIQFQLKGYSNPGLALPNGNTCVCPGDSCMSVFKNPPMCDFGFTFIISAPDQSVRYFATDFLKLDSQGQISPSNTQRWDENFVVQLPSKPSAIDVFVHHLGKVINARDGSIVADDTLSHVDTFVVPLNNEVPIVGGAGQLQPKTFTGTILGTQLTLAYSISCVGDLIGPTCDYSCEKSKISGDKAICQSNSTGFYYICSQMGNGQVNNCNGCAWGVKDNSYCQDANGRVQDPETAGVVDGSWKLAAIILAILTVVFFILFVIAALFLCMRCCKKSETDESLPGHNYRSAQRTHDGQAARPLLQASHIQEPVESPGGPNLDAKPAKSALRKPQFVPPAHIGGSNSINDTLNSSFVSDVPMRPSRSEVV